MKDTIQKLVDKLFANKTSLNELICISDKGHVTYSEEISKKAGLYAFWLKNEPGLVDTLHLQFEIKGPKGKENFKGEWDWNTKDEKILLYVGKSTQLKKRLGGHLMLKTPPFEKSGENIIHKVNTRCQLRAGIEHILKNKKENTVKFILENISCNFIQNDCFIERFYAEDLAIGQGRPWFNIDSER